MYVILLVSVCLVLFVGGISSGLCLVFVLVVCVCCAIGVDACVLDGSSVRACLGVQAVPPSICLFL